jgi:hypothetical protein
MAGLDDFEPDFRMDAQGMSLASPENKSQWTLAHHVEFSKRQGIWAELAKNMAKPNAASAAAAPSLTGVPAERARLAIVASKNACAALWEGSHSQAQARPWSLLKQAMMLGGTSPSIGRDLLDEEPRQISGQNWRHQDRNAYDSVAFSKDASLAAQVSSQNTLLTFGILDMPLSDKTDMDVEEIIFLGVGFDSPDETLSITEKRSKTP